MVFVKDISDVIFYTLAVLVFTHYIYIELHNNFGVYAPILPSIVL